MQNNPLLAPFDTPFGAIPFDRIRQEHFLPAYTAALVEARANISAIRTNPESPDFSNTIEAYEKADFTADRVMGIYNNLYSVESDGEFKKLAEELYPLQTEFALEVATDALLFERIRKLYESKESLNLDGEEERLLEKIYQSFIRNGALLGQSDQEKLKAIDMKLSTLSPAFSSNVLDATNAFELHITDESRLSGLPDNAVSAAAHEAKKRGKDSGWVFTLQPPSLMPVLTYADDRELRKTLMQASGTKNLGGEFDNRETVLEITGLRQERASLLGYENHAQYVLERRMAGTPDRVFDFINEIKAVALPAGKRELEEIKALAAEMSGLQELMGWDLSYYANKLKQKRFDYDPEEFRPYLEAESVLEGAFEVARRLYGLSFQQSSEVPLYHDEVRCYEVSSEKGDEIGLLYVDLYPRETKRGGAWMDCFRVQGVIDGKDERPHILIAGNLTPATPDTPSLLSLQDANTLFHEFGHALHGLLSRVRHRSLASPNVYWDFVELPSQIMENWLMEEETLGLFARHYESDAPLPSELISKANASRTFNAGLFNLRQLSLGMLDMLWHTGAPEAGRDVREFELEATKEFRLLPPGEGAISPSFGHLFAGGYSAGYYSYKWAEVLDADAFELFKEKGLFDRQSADDFRKLLESGNSTDPMELYRTFRGREPDPKALLRRDGLI